MKREIKFRVWDKKYKEFINNNIGGYVVNGEDVELNKIFDNKIYVFQQFTGLKDKNGVDIYEGDIVILFGDDDEKFGVYWNDYEAKFELDTNGNGLGDWFNQKDRKVIGNIFENPKLLE